MKKWKLVLGISMLVLLVGCSEENKNNKIEKDNQSITYSVGEKAETDNFDVTINNVTFENEIKGKNNLLILPEEEGVQYLVLDTNFKNISQESKNISEGTLIVKLNGKEYKFDKSEKITENGWGIFSEEINPLLSKNTKIVYKLPKENFEEIYYIPGGNSKKIKINLVDKKETEVSENNSQEEISKNINVNPNYNNKIGDTIKTDYFDVTLNNVSYVNNIKTGNQFADIPGDKDSLFVVLDITFKNISQESRMLSEGDLLITYNGKTYKFDKSETILADGWGVLFEQINPFVSKKTKIVYKISKEIPEEIIYVPGRNSEKLGFIVYDKREEEAKKLKEEKELQEKQLEALKEKEPKEEKEVSSKDSSKEEIVKPKKLVYSEDDVYTHLLWKGYRGEDSLERFKRDHGLPANRVVDEKVLKLLGIKVKYK